MTEELKIIISAEIDKLRQELNKGQKELKNIEKQGKSSGGKLGTALKASGKVVGTAMAAMVAAVAAAGAALVGLTESTREYRTQQAMLATAFQTSGGSAEQAKEVYGDLYRVLGDSGQAQEAAQHLAHLTTEEQALSEWTTICQGVYATFGESLPIESLTEAANETAKTGELTGALADALNWAGINEEEFKDQLFLCNNEAEREALIRETLTGLYGEAAANYETTAADILKANEAQMALTESTAAAGAALEPVITTIKSGLAGALQGIIPSFTMFAEGFSETVSGVEGGAEKMIQGIKEMADGIIATIQDALPMLLTVGMEIIKALIEGIAAALPDLLATVGDVLKDVLAVLTTLIPMVVEAILGALPDLINMVFEIAAEILNALGEILPQILEEIVAILPILIQTILDNIPLLLEAAITLLMTIVEAIEEILPPLIEALPSIIDSILNCLLENLPVILEGAVSLFTAIIDAIDVILPALVEALPEIITSILMFLIEAIPDLLAGAIDFFFAIIEAIPQIIPDLIMALPQIITAITENLIDKAPEIFGGMFDGIVDIFEGIDVKFGEWFGDSWTSIKDAFKNTKDWFSTTFSGAYTKAKDAWKDAKAGFSTVWTNIKSAFGNISGWFKEKFGEAWDSVLAIFENRTTFGDLGDSILEGLGEAVNWLIRGINKVIAIPFNGIKSALDGIRDISFFGLSPFTWIPTINIPQIPELELYRGGVLEKGQVGILEGKGAEAVIPLEYNDGWLTKIAEKLHVLMGDEGARDIILQVDGRTLAKTSIKSINQLTKQTGKLDLILA